MRVRVPVPLSVPQCPPVTVPVCGYVFLTAVLHDVVGFILVSPDLGGFLLCAWLHERREDLHEHMFRVGLARVWLNKPVRS